MSAVLLYPAPASVQVPRLMAEQNLFIEFSRNPARFAYNRLVGRVPSNFTVGKYVRIASDVGSKVAEPLEGGNWPDNQRRPRTFKLKHEFPLFEMQRDTEGFELGGLTVDQAQFPIIASHSRFAAQREMTKKSRRLEKLLTTGQTASSDPPGIQFDTMVNVGGNTITGATESTGAIQNTFEAVKRLIIEQTFGAVAGGQVQFAMGLKTAIAITTSSEYRAWMRNHIHTLQFVARDTADPFDTWGFPPTFFGSRVTIFEEMIDTTEIDAATTALRQFFQGVGDVDDTAGSPVTVDDPIIGFIRQGELMAVGTNTNTTEQPVNIPTFSTVTEIFKEDMTMELFADAENRIQRGWVSNNNVIELTAPTTAFMVTQTLGAAV